MASSVLYNPVVLPSQADPEVAADLVPVLAAAVVGQALAVEFSLETSQPAIHSCCNLLRNKKSRYRQLIQHFGFAFFL